MNLIFAFIALGTFISLYEPISNAYAREAYKTATVLTLIPFSFAVAIPVAYFNIPTEYHVVMENVPGASIVNEANIVTGYRVECQVAVKEKQDFMARMTAYTYHIPGHCSEEKARNAVLPLVKRKAGIVVLTGIKSSHY